LNIRLILADLVVVVHLLFILFVIFGGLAVLLQRWVAWIHVPAVAWGAAIEFGGWICPLTPLEQRLRAAAGAGHYDTGFIQHYVMPVIYPAGLTREVQWLLGVAVLVLNALMYGIVLVRSRRSAHHARKDVPDPE
jgi:hypothetical protein